MYLTFFIFLDYFSFFNIKLRIILFNYFSRYYIYKTKNLLFLFKLKIIIYTLIRSYLNIFFIHSFSELCLKSSLNIFLWFIKIFSHPYP